MKIALEWLKRLSARDQQAAAPTVTPAPLLMALEPRIVYDASVAAVGAAQHHVEPAAHGIARTSFAQAHEAPAAVESPRAEANDRAWSRHMAPAERDAAVPRQVVFIDSSVTNYQQLVSGLPKGTAVVVLDANSDGLAQIAQYLQQHQGVGSIHLVSHGANGDIQAGSTWLNEADLASHSATLAQIGAAMKPGGDFLIYGCNVAANADGKLLVQQIASISHLNVAASTDPTGAAALGGDWTLEYTTGAVHTPVIFSATAERQYGDLLAQTVETYDAYANGGNGQTVSTYVPSFVLDGIQYTTDGAVASAISTINQGAPLSLSSSDGVLMVNQAGDVQMTRVTITLANGDPMAVTSFDFDSAYSSGTIWLLPNGGTAGEIQLTGSQLSGHVDLSGYSQFKGISSLVVLDTGDPSPFTPTFNNLAYVDLNSPPVLTATGGTSSFVAGDNVASTPVVVDSGMTLADGDSSTAASASVTITGNLHSAEDVLGFVNTSSATYGDISAGYNNAIGKLTLTSGSGTATIAQWQAALRAVTYTDTAVTPNTATRTISFSITSDGYTGGNTVTKNVMVTDTDQTPIVGTNNSTISYHAGTSAATIDSQVTVSDRDNATQASGTVSISGGFHAGDTLSFSNTNASTFGNISASYDTGTGVLTLSSASATATDAQWANALSAVTFSSTSNVYSARTIAFATSDGSKTSAAATATVNVLTPVAITTDAGSASFVAGDNTASTPVPVDAGLTVADSLSSTLASATISIAAGFHADQDVLGFVNDGATMGNIVGSYNSSTGVLTLTSSGANATLAQWQSALESVSYTNSLITPDTTTRTISITAVDGAGNSSDPAARTVTVTATDQTPIVTATHGTTGYVSGGTAVTIDSGVSVSDLDNATQSSATVSIAAGFHSGDTLAFSNNSSALFGNIAASYNSATGVLTLTSAGATATTAQWSSALSSVTFSSTSTTYGSRTVSFATSDGTKTSTAATDTVNVTAPPMITTDVGSASFVAGDNIASTPVAIDSGVTVTDGSATTLGSATVAITGSFHAGEDVLSFTNDGATMGNISASYNATTGVLTLTSSGANATLAQWQSALRSVTYTDTAITPNNATRTIGFTAVDGAGNASATATRTVTVTDTDQTPIVSATQGTTQYVGGTAAVTIDGGISVSDLDNATQSSATVAVTSGFHSGDTLTFVNTNSATYGNIVASYNSATGVLTLTSSGATASNSQWAHALGSVTFSASSSATPGNRTVSFNVNDGTKTSAAASDTVAVLGPPAITTDSGSAAFVEADNVASTPVAIDAGLTLTDGTSSTLASATVAVTGNFRSTEDVLAFTNTSAATYGNIAASYDGATGVLTLTSAGASATLVQWQAALQSVTYTDTAIVPNTATRTISYAAVDTGAYTSNTATRTVTVAATDQSPIVSSAHPATSYVAGMSAAIIDGTLSVSDSNDATQSSATVAIAGGFQVGDTLTFVNTSSTTYGNIVASYNSATGVLTLASSGATASNAQWSQALAAVTFSSGSGANPGNRSISFTINDGVKTSQALSDTVTVLGPPQLTTDSGSASFVAGDNATSTPVAIDAGLTVTDGATATLGSGTVAITGNFHASEDVLGFVNDGATMGNIAASYNASTGVLTLSSAGASATLAQWQSALEAVTYTDTAITPNAATRTISFNAVDGSGLTSNTATRTVTVTAVDQTPIVTISGGSTAFVSGDNTASTPVRVDPGLAVSDRDNGTLVSATVAIAGNFQAGQDVLAFVNDGTSMGNITGVYDAATGTLALTSAGGSATLAQWQAALASVTYTDTAVSPNAATRSIAFSVSDGTKTSISASRAVTVTATDQTPVVATSSGSASFVAGDNMASTPVAVDRGMALSDRDNTTFASATVAISGHFRAGEDVLAFANDGVSMGNITGTYDASAGVLTLSSAGSTATVAQWQAALASVTYTDTAITPDNVARTISFTVSDGQKNSVAATRAVTVTDTAQTPVVTTSSGSAAFAAGDNAASTPVAVDPSIAVSDRDSTTLVSATVAITGRFHAGEDVLAFANDGTRMGNITGVYDASTGVLTLRSAGGTATVAQWQAALASVTYTDTAITPDNATRTISFAVNDGTTNSVAATRTVTVADTDQTPVIATSGGAVSFGGVGVDKSPVAIDPGITVSDRDSATLARATVSIIDDFRRDEDVLHFANDGATMGNITGSYDAATGVLQLSSAGATATVAQWQAALAAVSYADTSLTATAGTRTVAFTVNDGIVDSAVATRTISVVAGFKGSLITPAPAPPSDITATSNTAIGTSVPFSPIVLNALADVPLLDMALPPTHTITFAMADTHHHQTALVGTTHVAPGEWALPQPIARPFNVPTTTVQPHAGHGERSSVALGALADANARVVAVTQANGHALPDWLRYDDATGTLHVRAPVHGATPRDVRLLLVMQDQQGHRIYREIVVDLGKQPQAATARETQAAAKPSLSDQLARERNAFHVTRPAPAVHPMDAARSPAVLASNH